MLKMCVCVCVCVCVSEINEITINENLVVNKVKCCADIQENKNRDRSTVRSHEKVICDLTEAVPRL